MKLTTFRGVRISVSDEKAETLLDLGGYRAEDAKASSPAADEKPAAKRTVRKDDADK